MKHIPAQDYGIADIIGLDYEGRGIARTNGKTVFIAGALTGEQAGYRICRRHKDFDEAEAADIIRPSVHRRKPPCPHFNVCGGCALQHLDDAAQTAVKQRIAEEQLVRIGKVRPDTVLPPIYGTAWHYRQRGRFAVCLKNGKLNIGFQGRKSHDVAGISTCPVLPPHLSEALPVLQEHLQPLAEEWQLRFIEFAVGGNGQTTLNFGIRAKHAPNKTQTARMYKLLEALPSASAWQIWMQNGRQPPQLCLPEHAPPPSYRLLEFGIEMPFRPGDFTQVNSDTNALMVARAVRLLDPQPCERIADLFCGLGNFTLPLAKSGADVLAVEGSASLTGRARANARLNGCPSVDFQTADLFAADRQTVAAWGKLDKMLLDPPRAGAYAVVRALHAPYLPQQIVYVSCNPATFARDAAVLVGKGYRFRSFGVMNLFPQTAHIESIGLFEQD